MKRHPSIARNTMILFGSGAIVQLIALAGVIYLARVLEPADFGKISFVGALMVYGSLITSFGLPLVGTRRIAGNTERAGEQLGHILTLRSGLTFLALVPLLVTVHLMDLSPEFRHLTTLYALGLLPSALYPDWAFQGVERMGFIGLGNVLKSGIYLALVVAFVDGPHHLLRVPCFNVLGSIVATGLLLYIFWTRVDSPILKTDLSE